MKLTDLPKNLNGMDETPAKTAFESLKALEKSTEAILRIKNATEVPAAILGGESLDAYQPVRNRIEAMEARIKAHDFNRTKQATKPATPIAKAPVAKVEKPKTLTEECRASLDKSRGPAPSEGLTLTQQCKLRKGNRVYASN